MPILAHCHLRPRLAPSRACIRHRLRLPTRRARPALASTATLRIRRRPLYMLVRSNPIPNPRRQDGHFPLRNRYVRRTADPSADTRALESHREQAILPICDTRHSACFCTGREVIAPIAPAPVSAALTCSCIINARRHGDCSNDDRRREDDDQDQREDAKVLHCSRRADELVPTELVALRS